MDVVVAPLPLVSFDSSQTSRSTQQSTSSLRSEAIAPYPTQNSPHPTRTRCTSEPVLHLQRRYRSGSSVVEVLVAKVMVLDLVKAEGEITIQEAVVKSS
jgi:hypothetical protein